MLSAESLLQVWEHGHRRPLADRSLQWLAYALPDQGGDALAGVDLSRRDWHLLQLRRQWFGSPLAGYADCPACGERMEINVDAAAIAGEYPADAPVFVSRDGRRFRFPTVGDLLAVAAIDDAEIASRQLLERCSLDAPPCELPAIFDEVDEGLAAMAADRGFFLSLSCTNCGAPSRHALDPGEYLWSEISSAAAALLEEVHLLASTYGWAEHDILAMSAARRRAYLARIES
jgi:hypothetical protein